MRKVMPNYDYVSSPEENQNVKDAIYVIDDYIQKHMFRMDSSTYKHWVSVCHSINVEMFRERDAQNGENHF